MPHNASATRPLALEIRELSFSHGERAVLHDIDLAIDSAETVMLLGPNGAGKSTLFSLVAGLYPAPRGSIRIAGIEVSLDAAALASLGIVFQTSALDLDLSVEQNLRYFSRLQGMGRSLARQRIDAALDWLDLGPRRQDRVRELNGGHRRRVELARALLHEPRLILLDEPTVGLDIQTRDALIRHLHELPERSGCSLLWATHLVDEIAADDRLVILHQGRIHHDGAANAFSNTDNDPSANLQQGLTRALNLVTGHHVD